MSELPYDVAACPECGKYSWPYSRICSDCGYIKWQRWIDVQLENGELRDILTDKLHYFKRDLSQESRVSINEAVSLREWSSKPPRSKFSLVLCGNLNRERMERIDDGRPVKFLEFRFKNMHTGKWMSAKDFPMQPPIVHPSESRGKTSPATKKDAAKSEAMSPAARALAAAVELQLAGKPVSIRAACERAGVDRTNLRKLHPDVVQLLERMSDPDLSPRRGYRDSRSGSVDGFDLDD